MLSMTSRRCWRARLSAAVCAVLTLVLAPAANAAPPGNDAFANAQLLTGPAISITASNVDATLEPDEPLADYADATVWYRWMAPTAGAYQIDTCASGFDTVLGVFTGTTLASLNMIAASDDGCGSASLVKFRATAGTAYWIAVGGYDGAQGAFSLAISSVPPPPNDNFAAAQILSGGSWQADGSALAATSEPGEPAHGGLPAARTVWFRWVAPVSARYQVHVNGDVRLALYSGGSLTTLAPVAASYDANEGDLRFTSSAGTEYRIAVNWTSFGPDPVGGSFELYGDSDAMAITPSAIDFGSQAVSTISAAKSITLRPIGAFMDVPPHIAIGGAHASDFIKVADDDSCPGGVCTYSLRFAPSQAGPRIASLVVDTWLGSYNVPLSGSGTPLVAPTPIPVPVRPASTPTGGGTCKLTRNTRRGAVVRCSGPARPPPTARSPARSGAAQRPRPEAVRTSARVRRR